MIKQNCRDAAPGVPLEEENQMNQGNILDNDNKHDVFEWDSLGDITGGRGELGEDMPVLVYRLLLFTLLDVLSKAHGREQANDYFRKAGYLAGSEFARNTLDLSVEFKEFVTNLQSSLETLKIGVLHTESYDPDNGSIVLTVEKDLDCSGLKNTSETVCNYDEGFISGILEAYTGQKYLVSEVDCWANGDKLCRFNGAVVG